MSILPELFIKDDDKPLDTLAKSYIVEIRKRIISIPLGFMTDYASIPRFMLAFFVKYEKAYKKAAVIHDWLYWSQTVSRKNADDILNDAMYLGEIPNFKRWLIYIAVRVFGGIAWRENQRRRLIAGLSYRIEGSVK
jgi:hypothetical protein